MSNEIVPFASAQLPAYMQNRKALSSINKDVVTSAAYPTLSIKGKVFTLVINNQKQIMMNPEPGHEDETLQYIQLNVLRANTKARVFYDRSYVEGESEHTRPTCFSNDGVSPHRSSETPQCAKCSICPQNVWGSRLDDKGQPSEGTACSPNARLAVTAPDKIGGENAVFLLRVPAGSKKNYADAVKAADARGIPYNALVLKVGFDPAAPSPKLTFKPVGLLPDASFEKAQALYEDDLVLDIIGLRDNEQVALPAPAAGPVDTDELDAAIAAKAAVTAAAKPPAAPAPVVAAKVTTARVVPAVKPAAPAAPAIVQDSELDALVDSVAPPVAAPAPAPVPAPKPVVKAAAPVAPPMDDLLSELEGLLDQPDD
jgi:hypothetical protein